MKTILFLLALAMSTAHAQDGFHAALNLYNRGASPRFSAFEMWDGGFFYYQKDNEGNLRQYRGTPEAWMTFADIKTEDHGWQFRGAYFPQHSRDWNQFVNWARSEISNGSEYAVLHSENGSVVFEQGYFKFYIRGTVDGKIIMLNHPNPYGKCILNPRSVPVDGICAVFYLDKQVQ